MLVISLPHPNLLLPLVFALQLCSGQARMQGRAGRLGTAELVHERPGAEYAAQSTKPAIGLHAAPAALRDCEIILLEPPVACTSLRR